MAAAGPVVDRYRRLQLLGEGGAGQVWLVEDSLRPGMRLALKEASDGPADRAEILLREFVILSRLKHPGLVESFELDHGPSDGLPRFTLEHVDGESPVETVAREGAAACLQIAAEALRVVAFLHDFGLVHRDLKPANLLVRRRPRLGCRLVLLDLGLALAGDTEDGAARPAGTLPYMAPELFDAGPCTQRSDLYSLGATIHEIVHGHPPQLPKGDDLTSFVEAVREGRRARPALPPDYPEGFGDWIEALLSPDPADRPAGAREALARLGALSGSTLPAETAVTRAARLASDPPAGRARECERLRAALDPDRGPRLVWLNGPAGSGKSRLLRWIGGEALMLGWKVVLPGTGSHEALLRELRESASSRPTLLLVDEVETADGGLLRLLDHIAREGRAQPVQVVAALRAGEARQRLLRRLLDDTEMVPTMKRIDLKRLDEAAITEMARRATGGTELSDARLRWLYRSSEGSPLLAEALLVEDVWEKGGREVRPRAIEPSLLVRLDMLSATAVTWMEALVVLGRDADETEVRTLSGLEDKLAHEAEEEVRLAGLATDHDGHWSASSRSLAELILRRIRGERRGLLHQRAAEILANGVATRDTTWRLAQLWSGAQAPDRALDLAVSAARESLAEGEPAEGAERLAFALRHCPGRSARRFELRVEQGEALMAAGFHRAAARAFGAALRLAPDREARADLLGRQADALVQAGRFSRARKAADEALKLAESDGLVHSHGRALKAIGVILGRLGREDEAIPLLEKSLELAGRCGDAAMEAETLQSLAAGKSRVGRPDAEEDFRRAIALCRELESQAGELKSLVGLAVLQMRAGKRDEARRLLEEVRELAHKQGNLDLQETALSKLASLAIEQGLLDRAIAMGREALDLARHLGDRNRMTIDRCRLAEALVAGGLPAEAAERLHEGLDQPLEAVEPDMIGYARMLLARALLESPDAEANDIRDLLERCQQGFRERRKTRPLLLALALEMELLSRPGAAPGFEPVRAEFEALAAESEAGVEPEIRVRADLALAARLLGNGDAEGAEKALHGAMELAAAHRLISQHIRAAALLCIAAERSGQPELAAETHDLGKRLLEQAAERIEDEAIRQSFVSRNAFARLRERASAPAGGDQKRLLALYEMIRALNSESDPESLLESILDMALRAVPAERGMILLREGAGETFAVRLARNLESETERDAEEYSRGIVAQAGAGRSILALKAAEDERFRDLKSVSMYGIRSLMCVPLRSRERIIGTVYLDSRREGAMFARDDLRFIEAFADHAALALQNARERADLEVENRRLQAVAEDRVRFANIVGRSPAMQHVFDLIEKVASSDLPVLIQGDSGTGKELVARAIHFNGSRKRKIILSENCAAIPESLLESELFGHVRGAFTGAERDRSGLFEQADGGSLFLDEVGDMSHAMQARLLRALQEGEIRRVGADRPVRVNVRVIAATNKDLQSEVGAGRFREDLLYRLQVLMVLIPPLRERVEDIPLLIDHFLERIARERGRETPRVATEVREALERYRWPGNVRQLESTLHRLVLLAGEQTVTRQTVESDDSLCTMLFGPTTDDAHRFSLDDGVREELRRALAAAGGHRERAASLLGISRATIYRKIKEFGLK